MKPTPPFLLSTDDATRSVSTIVLTVYETHEIQTTLNHSVSSTAPTIEVSTGSPLETLRLDTRTPSYQFPNSSSTVPWGPATNTVSVGLATSEAKLGTGTSVILPSGTGGLQTSNGNSHQYHAGSVLRFLLTMAGGCWFLSM